MPTDARTDEGDKTNKTRERKATQASQEEMSQSREANRQAGLYTYLPTLEKKKKENPRTQQVNEKTKST